MRNARLRARREELTDRRKWFVKGASRRVVIARALSFLRSSGMAHGVVTGRLRETWQGVGTKPTGPGKLVCCHVVVWIHRLVIRNENFVIIKNGSISTGRICFGS